MQHDGHSRCVVGISVRGKAAREVQLLIFDPSTYGPDLKKSLETGNRAWHGLLKRGLHTLKKPEYQFVVVEPDMEPLPLVRTASSGIYPQVEPHVC